MKKKSFQIRIILTVLTVLIYINSNAQDNSASLPGNISLRSSQEELAKIAALDKGNYKYSIEDYFAYPKQSLFKLSPDGKYFSYFEKDNNGKNHVYVKNNETHEILRVIEEDEELIRNYEWANENRLIYIKDQGGNENYQLFAINLDGSNPKSLTSFEKVQVSILDMLKEQPDHSIIQMNKDNPELFEPYKINIKTGELIKLYENKEVSSPIVGYLFDKDGN